MKLEVNHVIPYIEHGLICEILDYRNDYGIIQ
jgi:hypothetical protein